MVQSNGDLLRLAPGRAAIIGHQATGRLVLDGDVILPADGSTMNERRKVGLHGQISVAVAVDSKGKLIGKPALRTLGVPVEEDKDAFLTEAAADAAGAVGKGSLEDEALRERVRLAVRRAATRWTGKKPIVDVLLVRA